MSRALVEGYWEWKSIVLGETAAHHKSRVVWAGNEPRPPSWEAANNRLSHGMVSSVIIWSIHH